MQKENEEIGLAPKEYVDVVVGGQAGSEGKGAIVSYLTRNNEYKAAIRTGSSNAGHTVYDENRNKHVQQVIPSPAMIDPNINVYIGAEASFSLTEIDREIKRMKNKWGNKKRRLFIDPKTAIIQEKHKQMEQEKNLGEDIGSTVHGCGAVRIDKIWRSAGNVKLAEDSELLSKYVSEERVSSKIYDHGIQNDNVILEGTQGTSLSLNHSEHYPFTTSRDCIASSFLSSAGISPDEVRDIWVVFRTYPIRVGGNSGDMMSEEISFEEIAERAGFNEPPREVTSVTNKPRRIFEWSTKQMRKSMRLNRPDKIAITFLDYIDVDNYGVSNYNSLTDDTKKWITEINNIIKEYDGELALLKTGEKPDHIIDLRGKKSVP